MKKVWMWSADSAGCYTLRMRIPKESIEEGPNREKFNIGAGSLFPEEYKDADVVVGQRVCKDGPSRMWRRFQQEGKRLVFEMDDDLFSVDPSNRKAFETFNDPKIQENLLLNITVSDTVTVSTKPLADVVYKKTGHPDIRVIPNAVPPWLLEYETEGWYSFGFAMSPTHDKDVKIMSRHLKRFLENTPEASCHAIGADYGIDMKLPRKQYRHTPWIKDVYKSFTAADFLIGLAPLAPMVFNRSKSDLRFLQNAAVGIPTIVSDVAAYSTVEHKETGFVVKYDHEWGGALSAMYHDDFMREELAKNAKEYVTKNRTSDNTRPLWEEALSG